MARGKRAGLNNMNCQAGAWLWRSERVAVDLADNCYQHVVVAFR